MLNLITSAKYVYHTFQGLGPDILLQMSIVTQRNVFAKSRQIVYAGFLFPISLVLPATEEAQ